MAFLYITEQGAVLRRTGHRLIVEKDETVLADVPASKVEGVMIFGNVQFTTQAVRLLLECGIEMALFTSTGRLLGQITSPSTKNIVLRQAQYARSGDPAFVLSFARIIVEGKIRNALEFLREFQHNHPEPSLEDENRTLSALLGEMPPQADMTVLLGHEGIAARTYFSAFAKMVRHSFSFTARHRHPSPDPVNALLSLGYTLVYNEISSLHDGLGFDPYLGFYHQPHYGHATLASDLLEEFRSPLVDRLTLSLVNNRVFKEEDFFLHEPTGGIYLRDDPRKRYFHKYEEFVARPATCEGGPEEVSFRKLFRRQAERLKDAVTSGATYEPFRFSW